MLRDGRLGGIGEPVPGGMRTRWSVFRRSLDRAAKPGRGNSVEKAGARTG
jgi:hypothetical protein